MKFSIKGVGSSKINKSKNIKKITSYKHTGRYLTKLVCNFLKLILFFTYFYLREKGNRRKPANFKYIEIF